MFYSVIPILSLQSYIENIWYCNRYIDHAEHTQTLPLGRTEIVIRFSGVYSIRHQKMIFKKSDCWVSGQQTGPTVTTIAGQHECMGVVFTPLGWNAFSSLEAGELINISVDLADVLGKGIGPLRNELAEIKFPEAKIYRLQQFLFKKLSTTTQLSTIQQALHLVDICGRERKVTVTGLCGQLKISRKSLHKHFQKYVGLPPSAYIQQRIFNTIIKEMNRNPEKRLIEVGYDYDFFDQSHFIKQFQLYAGITPGEYLQLVRRNIIDKTFPNFFTCPEVTFLQ